MKKIGKVFFPFLLGIILGLSFNYKVDALDECYGECISQMDVKLDVKKDGLIQVTQDISYNFGTAQKHGIYVSIPEYYLMNFDGTEKGYFWHVSDIKVRDYPYSVDSQLKGEVVRIGSENDVVSGLVKYHLEYNIHSTALHYQDLAMLYFNLVGDGWDVDILKTNFEIDMPQLFTETPYFYAPYGNNDAVSYTIVKNTIKGSYEETIYPHTALTIYLKLPSDYFIFKGNVTTFGGLIYFIGSAAIAALAFMRFYQVGRDKDIVPTVEFEAPDGLSSAQVGYLANRKLDKKEIGSLFVYWASKGYLKIKQTAKNKITVLKQKDIDPAETEIERSLFDAVFNNKDEVNINNLPAAFAKICVGLSSDYRHIFKGEQEIYDRKAFGSQVIFGIISFVFTPLAFTVIAMFLTKSFSASIIIGLIALVVFLILATLVYTNFRDAIIKSLVHRVVLAVITLALLVLSIIGLSVVCNIFSINIVFVSLGFIISLAAVALTALMARRTDYYNSVLGKILGLKKFIEVSEKSRIEMLVQENPHLFFDILPYAFVLGVSDKWIKQFEGINFEIPEEFAVSNLNFATNYLVWSSMMNNVSTKVGSSISKSSFGSSTTGGFSGGIGGGGFSGGGFGGGGGGSW